MGPWYGPGEVHGPYHRQIVTIPRAASPTLTAVHPVACQHRVGPLTESGLPAGQRRLPLQLGDAHRFGPMRAPPRRC